MCECSLGPALKGQEVLGQPGVKRQTPATFPPPTPGSPGGDLGYCRDGAGAGASLGRSEPDPLASLGNGVPP